jgi:hypothetical protein
MYLCVFPPSFQSGTHSRIAFKKEVILPVQAFGRSPEGGCITRVIFFPWEKYDDELSYWSDGLKHEVTPTEGFLKSGLRQEFPVYSEVSNCLMWGGETVRPQRKRCLELAVAYAVFQHGAGIIPWFCGEGQKLLPKPEPAIPLTPVSLSV